MLEVGRADGRRSADPVGPGHRLRDPVRPALRRLSRGRRPVRAGPSAERPAVPGDRPRRGPLRMVTEGRPGTPMPAFSRKKGGTLTDEQVQAIAGGIKSRWKAERPEVPSARLSRPETVGTPSESGTRAEGARSSSIGRAPRATGRTGSGARTRSGRSTTRRSWP